MVVCGVVLVKGTLVVVVFAVVVFVSFVSNDAINCIVEAITRAVVVKVGARVTVVATVDAVVIVVDVSETELFPWLSSIAKILLSCSLVPFTVLLMMLKLSSGQFS